MSNLSLIANMADLKQQYEKLQEQARNLKTASAREKRFDSMRTVRRAFSELQSQLDWSQFDIRDLNLMAPASGPWALRDAENFECMGWWFSFNFKGDSTKYVGEFSLLDNKCGIDNLKQLTKQLTVIA